MVEQEEHLWMMNLARVVIPIVQSLVDKENPFSFFDGYQNLQCSITWKPSVLKVTSTQRWKITSIWKISFYEHLSSPHWLMSEPKFYLEVQIWHRCIDSSLWAKATNNTSHLLECCFLLWQKEVSNVEIVSKMLRFVISKFLSKTPCSLHVALLN